MQQSNKSETDSTRYPASQACNLKDKPRRPGHPTINEPVQAANTLEPEFSLAAAAEINQRTFEASGNLTPTSQTWANAPAFASMNNSYLAQYGIGAVVTEIRVDTGKETVLVQVSASLQRLFPSVVPDVIVSESGFAEIQAFTR